MSTDTYFDFYSPKAWELYCAWNKACMNAGRTNDRSEYEKTFAAYKEYAEKFPEEDVTERIGYVYNYNCDSNYVNNPNYNPEIPFDDNGDLSFSTIGYFSDVFCKKYSNKIVSQDDIESIVKDYQVMYNNAMADETNTYQDDMASSDEIKELLESHIGMFLYIRVD